MKEGSYEDIINLPHPDSKRHPRMPRRERAAQFAPFAALKGYDEALSAQKGPEEDVYLSEEDI